MTNNKSVVRSDGLPFDIYLVEIILETHNFLFSQTSEERL